MKKKLLVLVVLALALSLPAGALAAAFPPSSLAFQWDTETKYTVLTVKLAGTVKMAPGPVKFYQLSGASFSPNGWYYPVTGSGYFDAARGKFFFTLYGDIPYGGYAFEQFHGYLFSNGTGTAYTRMSQDLWGSYVEYDIVMVPPNTLTLP